ncbi:MAG: amidase [Asgard group archaeon]|nr:amidase [Asgard group archaeon]
MKEYTIDEIQEKYKLGLLSCKQLVEQYLKRIKEIDKSGPKLNAIIEINPDAIKIAEQLDHELKSTGSRGPLHGVPIIIKDNINTHDKMMTTAGSLALEGLRPFEDAFIIRKLREAGAIILAKANLSEWANFRSSRSTSGWSSRGRQTKNPYILDRSPCGSSSGSAVAVAANLCVASIGTETDGSIVCPAHINGLVGIKPTIGLVSRTGIVPIAHSQDTAGPMARTVRDAVILLYAMIGEDKEDTVTSNDNVKNPRDYTGFLLEEGLKEARIGVARNLFGFNPDVDEIINNAIEIMKKHGAEIIDPANLESIKEIGEAEFTVLLYEFKHDINVYLAKYGKDIENHTLEDLIAFNELHKDKIMPYFGQEAFKLAQEKGGLKEKEYLKARETCLKLAAKEGIDAVIKEHNLDAIIAPTGSPAWPIDLINGDHFTGGSSRAAAIAGYPNITVPAGYIHGLPVGMSFFGAAFQEPTLIKIAYAFEQATKVRLPPKYLVTLKLQ